MKQFQNQISQGTFEGFNTGDHDTPVKQVRSKPMKSLAKLNDLLDINIKSPILKNHNLNSPNLRSGMLKNIHLMSSDSRSIKPNLSIAPSQQFVSIDSSMLSP